MHLREDSASFSRRHKGRMVIIHREMVYAEMFYRGGCCFLGGGIPPNAITLFLFPYF